MSESCPLVISQLRNNCTLVAVKEVTGLPDEVIVKAFLAAGYVPHKGTMVHQYMRVLTNLGFKHEDVRTSKHVSMYVERRDGYDTVFSANVAFWMTLGQFVREYPKGVFVVRQNGHAFVVREGRIVDPNAAKGARKHLRRRIIDAFRISDPASTTYGKDVGIETYKLKRGDNPIVYFRHMGSDRRRGTKGYAMEVQARHYISYTMLHAAGSPVYGVRLNDLVRETTYSRSYAAYDLSRGILAVREGATV